MNENIRQKLFHYSETPPPAAWNRIAKELDENPDFAQRLYDFEAQPAAGVWKNIDQQLTAAEPKVVPLGNRIFKYAIAAAVLIAIAVGSVFYLKQNTAPGLAHTTQKSTSDPSAKNAFITDSPLQSSTETVPEQNNGTEYNAAVTERAAKTDHAAVEYSERVRIPKEQLATNDWNVMPEGKTMINTDVPDRYIIATTQTGKVVRLPKKVYSDYVCAETYQNYQCKERIAAMQSKMATSVATDFTDFIDLLKKLQDNP